MPSTVPSESPSSPPASDLAAAVSQARRAMIALNTEVAGEVVRDLKQHVEAAFTAYDRALSSLGDGDDSARLEMTEAEAEAIWQEAERNPPSPDSLQRVKDGVMRRLGFEPSAECETAWLIEADGPSWWTGRDASAESFDTDPNEAIRFARREDADRAKHWLLSEHAFALRTTEHMWVDAARTAPGGASNG